MAESLLDRSTRHIDESRHDGPRSVDPMDGSLLALADGVAMTCGFSHVWALGAAAGLAAPDTWRPGFAPSAQD